MGRASAAGLVLLLVLWTPAVADEPPKLPLRLLVIGLDGADWAILDPLIEQGRLPNLQRLVREGTRADLLSISPMLSPVVWTTIATGVEPTRHGILDFLVPNTAGGGRQPVGSADRRVPTVWEMLSREGIPVGVVGWWASWPADPVRGYLVADRVAYQLFGFHADAEDPRGKTWPPDLYPRIRPRIVEPRAVGWERIRPLLGGTREEEREFQPEERTLLDGLRTLVASGETYLAIDQELRHSFSPQLEVVYFEGTDTVGHLFMPYRAPALGGLDPQSVASFGPIVDRYYERVDGYVGELLSGREGDWTVLVLSDHGFAADATRPRSTDSRIGHGAAADWHRRFGVLILAGPPVRRGGRLAEASVYDVAPTILALFGRPVPRSWPGHVLTEAFTPESLAERPLLPRGEDPPDRTSGPREPSDPAAADLIAKLESLGYVSGVDAGAAGGESFTARNNAGVSLLAQGRYAEAEREFRAVLAEAPRAPLATVNLALALRFQGRTAEARELFERGLAYPAVARLAGDQLALLLLEARDLEGAERAARRVLEREPDAAEVRNTLGLIREARGDLAGAESEFRRAAELDPHLALARNNLGNLAARRGVPEQAEAWYLRAIEADPYFVGAYNNLALVYQNRGAVDRAIDLYDRALTKAPANAVVLNNLGSLHYASGDRDAARRLWQRAVAADRLYASPLNNLGGLAIDEGRYAAAGELLDRALALDPAYGDARLNLALLLRRQGAIARARDQLAHAAADPRVAAAAWSQLGQLELESGRLEPAADALKRALAAGPPSTEALNALGETYRLQGRGAAALEAWRRSLALDPDQQQLRDSLRELERGQVRTKSMR